MKSALTLLFALIIVAIRVFGQSSAFNYQGKLNDSGSAATGTYQFQFKLYDAVTNGNQIGNAIPDVSVNVSGGVCPGISTATAGSTRRFSVRHHPLGKLTALRGV
jgi:hypothetical protein